MSRAFTRLKTHFISGLCLTVLILVSGSTGAMEQEEAAAASVDGTNSQEFASSSFRLQPVWAAQVDSRWRAGDNVGNEDDGITAEFVEFSTDGKRLVSANGLGEAFVINVADGASITTASGSDTDSVARTPVIRSPSTTTSTPDTATSARPSMTRPGRMTVAALMPATSRGCRSG